MTRLKYESIACDFDGTIVSDNYPKLGALKPDAVRVLKKIVAHGGRLIIWTCRTGNEAELVKKMLADAGIVYHAFNDNLEENKIEYPDNSRKVFADTYIDDRSIYCDEVDWVDIENRLFV